MRIRRCCCCSTTAFLLLVGCGGAPAVVDRDQVFAEIQIHEATIAHRAAEMEACVPEEPCGAEHELCDAVEALCTLSRSIEDADAATRCEMARRRCPEAP